MNKKQFEELLLQSLEHEKGGVEVYTMAIKCAVNGDLKKEWTKYLEETKHHVEVLEKFCKALKLDSKKETPGRAVVKHLGAALVTAMEMAKDTAEPPAAQLVACECVVLAETKDHLDWTLINKCVARLDAATAKAFADAHESVEDEEDEHLYHSRGWCRELWIDSLGIEAMLPPPEEKQKVKTAMAAARAEQLAELHRIP